ncbi:3-phosphoshikimate 1-carboxyvinyltransferase [Blattabacterium cuenoti]|uniref:3-phosphoshikimate 1-carboxyvinyltransferase n=1 Tax=Blattabacterium cuenoti TaxID=1653831 RepID=UPI00163BB0A7|nr:3-phosphoshikimate 1-carboxyvinyltransferase [Blattabacterium cuenoti]
MSSYINLYKKNNSLSGFISITGSKSLSNRLLILKAIYNDNIQIKNLSNCEDTKILKKSLESTSNIINVHHAGTAMRFLTSYFAIQEGKEIILTGSNRMKERPILGLVEALRKLGSKINFLENNGYPPIKIFGKKILGGNVDINAKISSQYITSLMLVANKFKTGLRIYLKGHITSIPYIKMTFDLLTMIGIKVSWEKNFIHIYPTINKGKKTFYIESDWSSASYYYSISAIAKNSNITLSSYNEESLQGDKEIVSIYKNNFGVCTSFNKKGVITLRKNSNFFYKKFINLKLDKTPDIAQTIVVTCAILGIKCSLKGLETLKIKETDRLFALREELLKFGIITKITDSCLEIIDFYKKKINTFVRIKTYQDHRMAMSFSPFGLCSPFLQIEEPNVVEKSYPNFWNDLKSLGFLVDYYEK